MLSNVERLILELVATHNGEWYWYQIDRALSNQHGYTGPYQREIEALEHAGLIEIRACDDSGTVRYWITDVGRVQLIGTTG